MKNEFKKKLIEYVIDYSSDINSSQQTRLNGMAMYHSIYPEIVILNYESQIICMMPLICYYVIGHIQKIHGEDQAIKDLVFFLYNQICKSDAYVLISNKIFERTEDV